MQILEQDRKPGPGETLIDLGGGLSATVQIDRFAQAIIDSALFRSLAKTLDDPTRFDHLAKEIRDELVRSIADEAAKRGAEVRDLQTIVQTNERSFARQVREVTASLQQASAGIRATQAAWSDGQRAMATNVLQLQASLGRYYRDGTPGRASLEQEMTVLASYSDGLRAQYTLKVQAGGALAGFGIAAEERNGQTTSAFIIMADKFAVVAPNYSGGLLRTPRPQDVVFGVDGNGIYLQNNVYVKGNLRVDGQGRTLADGMRGSVLLSASGSYWSDATARQAVWQALGNGGSAPNNNHLQVGDAVTITDGGAFTQTRHWMGYYWAIPGAVLSGDLLVDGTVAARKVDTRGLTVRDSAGNIIPVGQRHGRPVVAQPAGCPGRRARHVGAARRGADRGNGDLPRWLGDGHLRLHQPPAAHHQQQHRRLHGHRRDRHSLHRQRRDRHAAGAGRGRDGHVVRRVRQFRGAGRWQLWWGGDLPRHAGELVGRHVVGLRRGESPGRRCQRGGVPAP